MGDGLLNKCSTNIAVSINEHKKLEYCHLKNKKSNWVMLKLLIFAAAALVTACVFVPALVPVMTKIASGLAQLLINAKAALVGVSGMSVAAFQIASKLCHA